MSAIRRPLLYWRQEDAGQNARFGLFILVLPAGFCDERRAAPLRDAVSILPLERVLIETDAPYLTPRGFHLPRTNVPNNITYVARTLAGYMDVSVEELIAHAKENTEKLLNYRKTP